LIQLRRRRAVNIPAASSLARKNSTRLNASFRYPRSGAAGRITMMPQIENRKPLVCLALMLMLFGQNSAPLNQTARARTIPQPDTSPEFSGSGAATVRARVEANFGRLPLGFEFNKGQADPRVKFMTHGQGYGLFLTSTEAVMNLRREENHQVSTTATLRMTLPGSNPQPRVIGVAPLPGEVSYFLGSDETRWRRDVPTYGKVKYEAVYPGIDLVWYGNQRQLEYDFIVAPGADPQTIRLKFAGAGKLRLDVNGDLALRTGAGEVRHHKPLIYQEVDGQRREIAGHYVISGKNQVGFVVGEYDTSLPLVIDPSISYATYLNDFAASDIAVDAAGNAYVIGTVNETFQASPGAVRPGNVFVYPETSSVSATFVAVMKINPQGTDVLYKAVLGGTRGVIKSLGFGVQTSLSNQGRGIAVDAAGAAYLTGLTVAYDFPTTPGAIESNFNPLEGVSGTISARAAPFVCKLDSTGSQIVYSTLIGSAPSATPTLANVITDIAVDALGNACVTGVAGRAWPTTPTAFQPNPVSSAGESLPTPDAFVTKLNANGTGMIFSTYLGSSTIDLGKSITVDAEGSVYIAGITQNGRLGLNLPQAPPFPATRNFFSDSNEGAFIAKFAAGGERIYSGIVAPLGGLLFDRLDKLEVAVDAAGSAYVAGTTSSAKLPVTANAYQQTGGADSGDVVINDDLFIVKLKPAGDELSYATYLGKKTEQDKLLGLTADRAGNATVIGWSRASSDPSASGQGFAARLSATGENLLETYNFTLVYPNAVAFDPSGNAYLVGAPGQDFAATPGVFNPTSKAGTNPPDNFESALVKIAGLIPPIPDPTPTPTAATSAYYFISGRVLDNYGRGMEKVRVVLTGPETRADYTDRNGNYSLGSVQGGQTYRLQTELPSIRVQYKTYYVNPGWYTLKNLSGDQRLNFTYDLTSPWVPPPDDPTPTPTPTVTPTPTPTPGGGGNDGKILNPGFEEGLAYWRTSGIVSLERGRSATEGSTAVKLQPTSPWNATLVEQIVQLTPGASYELCADIGSDKARASLGAFSLTTVDGYSLGVSVTAPGGAARKVALRFTVPPGSGQMKITAQATGNVGASAIVDNFRLVRVQ
jgi:hypothetical protein